MDKLIFNENTEKRLDIFLTENLDINRSQIKKLIKSKKINVNGNTTKAGYILRLNDSINIEFEEEIQLLPQQIEFKVLYEDDAIAVISKPQNLVVHFGAGNFENTLVNGLLYRFKNLSNIDPLRHGIVHRLDKDTSGLMIIAKTNDAHVKLVESFKNSNINKTYIAIVHGITDDAGIINEPIGRDPKNRIKMSVVHENSKSAITNYSTIKNYKEYSLVKVNIVTGRTHQIRVHFAYINHPVVGDLVYGHKNKFKIDKQMLHSLKLNFKHPITGEDLSFEDEFPSRFTKFLNRNDI